MQLLDRADRVRKAIPFIISSSTWVKDPPAGTSFPFDLWQGNGRDRPWTATALHLFYTMWTRVSGHYVDVQSSNANVQAQAFVNQTSATFTLCLNSLYQPGTPPVTVALQDSSKTVSAAGNGALQPKCVLNRLFLGTGATGQPSPVFDSQELPSGPPVSIVLGPEESVVLQCHSPAYRNISASHLRQITVYGCTRADAMAATTAATPCPPALVVPITAPQLNFSLTFNDSVTAESTLQRAVLRLGLGGVLSQLDLSPLITVDGVSVRAVPATDVAGPLHNHRGQFLGVLSVPLPPEAVVVMQRHLYSHHNVTVAFRPGTVGHISTLALWAWLV